MNFLFKALGALAHSIHKRLVSSKCQSCIGMGEKLIFPSWGARHASRFLSKLARFVAPLWGATFLQRTHHALIFSWWKMALLHFGAFRLSCLRWDSGILGRILNGWFYQMEHQGLQNQTIISSSCHAFRQLHQEPLPLWNVLMSKGMRRNDTWKGYCNVENYPKFVSKHEI